MAWVSLNNLTRFYTKLKEKFYLKTEVDTKISELNSNITNKTRINYLRPTLQTQTIGSVTCTNNGDGTYTLSGTGSAYTGVTLCTMNLVKGKTYTWIGQGQNIYGRMWFKVKDGSEEVYGNSDIRNSFTFEVPATKDYTLMVGFVPNETYSGILKPMITDDLSATYDDFVSGFDCLTPDLKMDLLWENASPTSAFPSQTISLDLSNYKNIVVLSYENFSTEARRNQFHTDVVVKNTSSYLSCPNNEAAANTIRWRMCTASDTSITFGVDDTQNANYCIPFKIWGVR